MCSICRVSKKIGDFERTTISMLGNVPFAYSAWHIARIRWEYPFYFWKISFLLRPHNITQKRLRLSVIWNLQKSEQFLVLEHPLCSWNTNKLWSYNQHLIRLFFPVGLTKNVIVKRCLGFFLPFLNRPYCLCCLMNNLSSIRTAFQLRDFQSAFQTRLSPWKLKKLVFTSHVIHSKQQNHQAWFFRVGFRFLQSLPWK